MFSKRFWIVVAFLFVCPALASAQLRFTQTVADLGARRGGPAYQHRFEFVNESSTPIEITDIRVGCGCLSPVLDQRIVQPGAKGSLLMHLRTLGQPSGARTWQARVQYRQGEKLQEVGLLIAATLRSEVTLEPSVVAMTVETTLKQIVTIKDHRQPPMKVAGVAASSPAIRVAMRELGGATEITLEVSGALLTAARQEETLNIYTSDPDYRHLQVPITLTKARRADVSVAPDKLEIVGSAGQLVRLRAAGDRVVRVEKIEADHAAIACTWAPGPGNDATLKVRVDASLLTAADVAASVRVRLAEPAAMLVIPVTLRKD